MGLSRFAKSMISKDFQNLLRWIHHFQCRTKRGLFARCSRDIFAEMPSYHLALLSVILEMLQITAIGIMPLAIAASGYIRAKINFRH